MKFSSSEPGIFISGGLHVALLVLLVFGFFNPAKMEGSPEAVSAEVITSDQFDQIMKGDKNEKEVKPDPKPKADKQSEITNTKPTPATPDATRDVPTPPAPLPRQDDPGQDNNDAPQPVVTAQPVPRPPDPTPPAPPTPAPPTPPVPPERPPDPKPEPPTPDAEATKPVPPPPPPRPVQTPPTPAAPPKPVQKQPDKQDKDQLAKMASVQTPQPPAKPKSGDAAEQKQYAFNPNAINNVLAKDAPQSTGSTAHQVNQIASAGAPTANAPKMSITMLGQFEADLISQYKRCWTYNNLDGTDFAPEIRVQFSPAGALIATPTLMNHPSSPQERSLADYAMRAVRMCNPLRIPEKYKPYYNDWKSYVLRFHPDEMAN